MNNPQEIELKPCAHCGNEADCDREPYPNFTIFSIWCKHCVVGVSHAETGPEVDLVTVWNTRPSPSIEQLTGVIESVVLDGQQNWHVHSEVAQNIAQAISNLLNGEGGNE